MTQLITVKMLSNLIALIILIWTVSKQVETHSQQISINMPDIRPDHGEQYLCISHRLPLSTKGQYVVGFNPKADVNRVHHMLIYGCQYPGVYQRDSPNFVWECGEMHGSSDSNNQIQSFEQGPVCRGQEHILYGWALNAPALQLPEGVGFKVGDFDAGIHYLVLQVHYGHYHAFSQLPDLTDNSGIILDLKPNKPEANITRQAGVLLLISYGRVMPGKTQHKIWCDIEEDIDIHPFRFRVHTHKLGTKVMAAKLSSSQNSIQDQEIEKNTLIGVEDPQKPQMFYPVKEKNLVIRKGDTVYAECQFNNNYTYSVNIGHTAKDEMCNFYLMYWTSSPKLLSKGNCFGANPRSISSLLW